MNNITLSDEHLIHQYILGDEKCLSVLFNRYQRKIITYLYFKVNDRQIAEDIFMESFFKIVRTIDAKKYIESGKFYHLLINISRNTCIDYFRKQKNKPSILDIDAVAFVKNIKDEFNSTKIEEQEFVLAQIKLLIQELPDDEKEIVILRHYADLTFKEISELTDININTALSKMRNALIRLKKLAKERGIKL